LSRIDSDNRYPDRVRQRHPCSFLRRLWGRVYQPQPTNLHRSSFRRHGAAFAQMLQPAVDPELAEFFLAVPGEAAAQGTEIDAVHLLVLVEAGEDDCLIPVTGSRWRCRHCAQISFIMHCIGELIEAIARWSGRK
jgi:hypothetical protein